MIRFKSSFLVAVGVLALATGASAQTAQTVPSGAATLEAVAGGLTAQQAAKRAAETSRSVYRLREKKRMREADVDRVAWLSLPRLNFSARYARLSNVKVGGLGDPSFGTVVTQAPVGTTPLQNDQLISGGSFTFPDPLLNSFSVGANVTVPLSDYLFKLGDTMAAAKVSPQVAELQVYVGQQTAAVAAKLDYYAWAQAKLNVHVAERAVAQAKERLQDMQRLLQSGRIAQADVLQAQAFAATTALTAERARTAVLLSESKLRIAVHAVPGEKLLLGENVLKEPLTAAMPEDPYREAMEHRLEIAVLTKSLEGVAASSRVRAVGKLPTLEAFADAAYSNPNPRVFPQQNKFEATWQIGLQLSWSPTDMGVANLDAQAEESRGVEIRSQLRELKDSLQLEVLTATRGVKEARLNIETARQVQHAATAAYEARSTLYRNGRATSFEILQAETGRINAEFGLVGAHIALHLAQVRLDHALGRSLY